MKADSIYVFRGMCDMLSTCRKEIKEKYAHIYW